VATALQDQLGPAVAGAFPDAAQFVLSAQQLMASSITPEVAASLRSVLVYGAGLHAFDALATLIEAGVDAGVSWQSLRSLPWLAAGRVDMCLSGWQSQCIRVAVHSAKTGCYSTCPALVLLLSAAPQTQ
jgi:hypothetical protein